MNIENIEVALGVASEVTHRAMRFRLGEEFTEFGHDYSTNDLRVAVAVLLDLADALTAKLAQKAH